MIRWAVRFERHTGRFQRTIGRCLTSSDNEDRFRKAEEGKLDHKTGPRKIPRILSRTKPTATLQPQRGPRPDATKQRDSYDSEDFLDTDEMALTQSFNYLEGGPVIQQAAEEKEEMKRLAAKYHEKDHLYYWIESDYDPMQTPMDEPNDPLPLSDLQASSNTEEEASIPSSSSSLQDEAEEIREDEMEAMEVGDSSVASDDDLKAFGDDELDAIEDDQLQAAGRMETVSEYDRNNDIITMLSDDKYLEKFQNMTTEQLEQHHRNFNKIKNGIDIYDPDPQTRFEAETYDNPHPNMMREPKVLFSKQRMQPPRDFVERHRRFLFITGLPPLTIEGALADVRDTTHQTMLRRAIVEALGKDIDTKQVFATDPSSGFVGFDSEMEVAKRLIKEPKQPVLSHSMSLSPIGESGGFGEKGTVLQLDHIPRGQHTPTSLLRELFPPRDSNEGAAFENLTVDDIKFLSSTKALIRFQSVDEALNASNSSYVKRQVDRLSQYPLKIFRARRELIHLGFGSYPLHKEERQFGFRLIVDGDMPTKPFYTSHAGVLRLYNLDPAMGPYELSYVFQPFCATPRDEIGSVEFIRCERGHATGSAYVGFDLPGEAEAAMKGLSMTPKIGDRKARLQLVRERKYPWQDYVAPERRPDRSIEELERDLNDWEQYVDPKDIQILADAGIRKEVLDDALRAMRQGNPTFGPLDAGLRSEALEPEKDAGQQYKDMVQLYIETLKECLATPDNPESFSALYKFLHHPGEEIDLSIFEDGEQKLAKQAEFRSTFKD